MRCAVQVRLLQPSYRDAINWVGKRYIHSRIPNRCRMSERSSLVGSTRHMEPTSHSPFPQRSNLVLRASPTKDFDVEKSGGLCPHMTPSWATKRAAPRKPLNQHTVQRCLLTSEGNALPSYDSSPSVSQRQESCHITPGRLFSATGARLCSNTMANLL